MGIVEKSIRKRSNQQLAAPIYVDSPLSPDELVTTVVAVCDAHNDAVLADLRRRRTEGGWLRRMNAQGTDANSLFCHASIRPGPELLIGYSKTPAQILGDTRKQQNLIAGHWLAKARFTKAADGTSTVVELQLLKWVIDSNGRLQNRQKYEELVDLIYAAVIAGASATSGS